MGKSFFLGNDAALYAGSEAFSTKISATPTAYGLVAAQATAYAALNSTYAAAYLAATDPATRTKAKIQARIDARDALTAMASNLAKIIDGTSTVTNEQKLDLGLSVRATPEPVPQPGTPTSFKVTLNADGSLDLGWKCKNPPGSRGTIYQVWRKIGAGEFTYVGGTGARKFVDSTVPAGTAGVTYQLQAVRSTAVGDWAQFNVNFGMTAGGTMTAAVAEAAPAKLAA